ncbi:TPA: hypothetical protein ACKPZV_002749 [Stenotrophomonas maltophilia]
MPEQSTSPPSQPLPPSKELFKILFDSGQKTFLSTFDRVVLSVYAVFLVILLAVAVAWGLAPHPDLRLMAWGIAILILVLGLLWVVATAATAVVALFNGSQSMHAAIDRRGLHAESVLLALRPFAQSDLRLRAEQYVLESSLAMRRHGLTAVIVGLSAASTPIFTRKGSNMGSGSSGIISLTPSRSRCWVHSCSVQPLSISPPNSIGPQRC